ncbi:unnamed protein product [Cochlearia groenlandica]
METASSLADTRGGSVRAVSDSHNDADYMGMEKLNLKHKDDVTLYENGREARDLDFYSIAMDGSCSDAELLEQLRSVSKEKGELQLREVELRARMMAVEIQRSFESRSAEYANAAARMQEHILEKERSIRTMERMIEEKDRELHAIKLDNEAAWAKEGLLREQNKELATLRRERDHTEAEKSQTMHKISELEEHIQEKESQFTELQEQKRIAQETILYKDEQLREAQSWITRAQEMDALQSSTNHSLQAELRERTEQYNQLWHGCQRQFAEMERLHLHTVQQLQLELANLRGGGSKTNLNSTSQIIQNTENQFESHDKSGNQIIQNSGNQIENKDADLGVHGYPQASQMTPLHSFIMHQQETPQLVQPRGPSPQVVQSMLLNQKAVPASSQMLVQNPSQSVHHLVSSDTKSEHQVSANGQFLGQADSDVQNSQGAHSGSTTPLSSVTEQMGDVSPQEATGQILLGEQNGAKSSARENLVSSGKAERNLESALLDERSLLASIVRTIPAGGRIRISSTLVNRLGKMLAPLHWHDYKKKYGKLDDFVGSHVELFVIEDDYIQVREGAQKMVAAAAAKVAAAAAAVAASTTQNSMYVAMTPMAQSQGLNRSIRRESASNVKILRKQSSD